MRVLDVKTEGLQAAVDAAVFVLRAGGIVIYPTETTYGVGVDVENPQAVQKLLDYKGKRDGKPISVAVADQLMAQKYVELNARAKQAYETFLPGPVTVVSTGTGKVAAGIASPEGKVGIRIPNFELALQLTRAFGSGISATGANASNKKRPYTIQDIFDHISDKQKDLIDLVLDVGELPHNEPSTVIDTTLDDLVILRSGQTKLDANESHESHNVAETIALFESVARRFRSFYTYTPVIFALEGEMGAGKTHAVKGIAKGLGIGEPIISPTYTFANEYACTNEGHSGVFVHIDAWRMTSFAELMDIGLGDLLDKKAVIAIEWTEKFESNILELKSQAKIVLIRIENGKQEEERHITLQEL
jgi:L-threonylcarbamoyladenylate synthase